MPKRPVSMRKRLVCIANSTNSSNAASVLQCVAVYCNALQCVAVRCSVLHNAAVCFYLVRALQAAVERGLQCDAMCCTVLQCVAVSCSECVAVSRN